MWLPWEQNQLTCTSFSCHPFVSIDLPRYGLSILFAVGNNRRNCFSLFVYIMSSAVWLHVYLPCSQHFVQPAKSVKKENDPLLRFQLVWGSIFLIFMSVKYVMISSEACFSIPLHKSIACMEAQSLHLNSLVQFGKCQHFNIHDTGVLIILLCMHQFDFFSYPTFFCTHLFHIYIRFFVAEGV